MKAITNRLIELRSEWIKKAKTMTKEEKAILANKILFYRSLVDEIYQCKN